MPLIAGVDGCRSGWLCLTLEGAGTMPAITVYPDAESLLSQRPAPRIMAIDIPIGLPDRGPRDCDRAARRLLGPSRGSSVFPAPIRPILDAASHAEANARSRALQGKGLSIQAWGITPKIRMVDAALRRIPERREWVHEVHPELAFQAWNGGATMAWNKKHRDGRRQRTALVEARYGPLLRQLRPAYPRREVGDDDLLDAAAALWTAERILAGLAHRLPESPPLDAEGLAMEIVY